MRIKSKPGYNVHLADINVVLQNNYDFIEVDDKLFNSSADAKCLMSKIIIDTNNTNSNDKIDKNNIDMPLQVKQVAQNTFVLTENTKPKQSGTIVFDPNNEADLTTVMTPNTVKQKATVIASTPKESAQNEEVKKVEANTVKQEDKKEVEVTNEVKDVKLDEIKIEVASEDTEQVIKEAVTEVEAKIELTPEASFEEAPVQEDSTIKDDTSKKKKKNKKA